MVSNLYWWVCWLCLWHCLCESVLFMPLWECVGYLYERVLIMPLGECADLASVWMWWKRKTPIHRMPRYGPAPNPLFGSVYELTTQFTCVHGIQLLCDTTPIACWCRLLLVQWYEPALNLLFMCPRVHVFVCDPFVSGYDVCTPLDCQGTCQQIHAYRKEQHI